MSGKMYDNPRRAQLVSSLAHLGKPLSCESLSRTLVSILAPDVSAGKWVDKTVNHEPKLLRDESCQAGFG